MSIQDSLAKLAMSGHKNTPAFKEQIERAKSFKLSVSNAIGNTTNMPQHAGRDRSGEFQPIVRPITVRSWAKQDE